MKICARCHLTVDDDDSFCPKCGHSVLTNNPLQNNSEQAVPSVDMTYKRSDDIAIVVTYAEKILCYHIHEELKRRGIDPTVFQLTADIQAKKKRKIILSVVCISIMLLLIMHIAFFLYSDEQVVAGVIFAVVAIFYIRKMKKIKPNACRYIIDIAKKRPDTPVDRIVAEELSKQ